MKTLPRKPLFRLSSNHQSNSGFTLIELFVVIFIIGVLGAIAFPAILRTVGRARESEATNTLGTLNRRQQTFHVERSEFATDINDLEVPMSNQYYNFFVVGEGQQLAAGINNEERGMRDFAGAVAFASDTASYTTVLCRALDSDSISGTETTAGSGSGQTAACGSLEEIN